MIVNIITLVTLSLTAMAIVREKEIGTMEQLMVTPIRPTELILGKTLPFVVVGFWDMLLVVGAALLIFHIPFRGQFLVAVGGYAAVPADHAGRGVVHFHHLAHPAAGEHGDVLFFQPFFMLSGFTFPIRNMPLAVQMLTYFNPMRYFMEIVRGIFLKGSGFARCGRRWWRWRCSA